MSLLSFCGGWWLGGGGLYSHFHALTDYSVEVVLWLCCHWVVATILNGRDPSSQCDHAQSQNGCWGLERDPLLRFWALDQLFFNSCSHSMRKGCD